MRACVHMCFHVCAPLSVCVCCVSVSACVFLRVSPCAPRVCVSCLCTHECAFLRVSPSLQRNFALHCLVQALVLRKWLCTTLRTLFLSLVVWPSGLRWAHWTRLEGQAEGHGQGSSRNLTCPLLSLQPGQVGREGKRQKEWVGFSVWGGRLWQSGQVPVYSPGVQQ